MTPTPAIFDFAAIGKKLAPATPDLRSLVAELKQCDQTAKEDDIARDEGHLTYDEVREREDRRTIRVGELFDALQSTPAKDMSDALALLEFFDYYLGDNDPNMTADNTPAFRSALGIVRARVSLSEPQLIPSGDTEYPDPLPAIMSRLPCLT